MCEQPTHFLFVFSSSNVDPQGSSARDSLLRVGALRQGRGKDGAGVDQAAGKPSSAASTSDRSQASVSDSLAAAMPGSFLTATDLQELARVYVVCLK